ncbi:MAG: c-type cytochrome [Gammaproteobacteria bacterium]
MSQTCRTILQRLTGLLLMAVLAACGMDDAPLTADGFVLPPGDVERGQAVFVEMGCNRCHVVTGLDLPAHAEAGELRIELGGKRAKIKDYGELLTSVVHPQHAIAEAYERTLSEQERARGETPMPDFNSRMTVAQLIDLVQFLHSRYEELVPDYRGYRYYYGP